MGRLAALLIVAVAVGVGCQKAPPTGQIAWPAFKAQGFGLQDNELINARTGSIGLVVLAGELALTNSDGIPNPPSQGLRDWIAGKSGLKQRGVKVFGYVPVCHGGLALTESYHDCTVGKQHEDAQPNDSIQTRLKNWKTWYGDLLTGIYLDEGPYDDGSYYWGGDFAPHATTQADYIADAKAVRDAGWKVFIEAAGAVATWIDQLADFAIVWESNCKNGGTVVLPDKNGCPNFNAHLACIYKSPKDLSSCTTQTAPSWWNNRAKAVDVLGDYLTSTKSASVQDAFATSWKHNAGYLYLTPDDIENGPLGRVPCYKPPPGTSAPPGPNPFCFQDEVTVAKH